MAPANAERDGVKALTTPRVNNRHRKHHGEHISDASSGQRYKSQPSRSEHNRHLRHCGPGLPILGTLRCQLYPPMNESHSPWISSRGPVSHPLHVISGHTVTLTSSCREHAGKQSWRDASKRRERNFSCVVFVFRDLSVVHPRHKRFWIGIDVNHLLDPAADDQTGARVTRVRGGVHRCACKGCSSACCSADESHFGVQDPPEL